MQVGKLELDADPVVDLYRSKFSKKRLPKQLDDIALLILTIPRDLSFPSELIADGHTKWKEFIAKRSELVDVRWNVNWVEIMNGISTTSVYEFQAWFLYKYFISNFIL